MSPRKSAPAGPPITLRGEERAGIRRRAEPVTVGVPLPRGLARHAEALSLRAADGTPVPVQAEATDRWPDGSLRWVLLDFAVDAPARGAVELALAPDPPETAPVPASPVRISPSGDGLFVDTGAAQFVVDPDAFLPFRSVRTGGEERLDPRRSGWRLLDDAGREWTPAVRELFVETRGPLRSTVRVEGDLVRAGAPALLAFVARLHFHAGSASARVVLTVRNPRRAAHRGGHWELGDPGSVLFRDLSFSVAVARGGRASWSPEPNVPLGEVRPARVEIYQDSSGGENWRSPVHRTRDGVVPVAFRGWRVAAGGEEREGRRATPRVAVHDGSAGASCAMARFWENFPKAMEASEDGVLTLRLWPERFSALHELQGGEQKTHELWLSFGPDALDPRCDFQRAPLRVLPEPDAFLAARVAPYLTPPEDDLHARLVAQAVEGDDTFRAKRERADEYGWRHFGDLWADHESKYHEGASLFVSHYNNQYDVVYGAFLQLARTGDARWFDVLEPLARHAIDIDVYHTDEDRTVYNRGLFWHTAHYVEAGLSTHRSYPKGDTIGGGPDNEHNYSTGFAHYGFLTGDPLGRAAAIERAQWVIDADDGELAGPLRWIARGPTGLASKTRDFGFHGPGRGAGNSVQVLLDGWRLTGEERFLDKAVELIRRTVHPADDPGAYDLTDSETRWSYTVHLQAVGRFLDEMADAGRLGEPYAYARESLLTYARWMAEHERPALDFPERLDHPTETWAVQDIRKSEVFLFAALHSTGDERARFLERADHFHRYALETLDAFPTRGYTRPVSLLMRYGLMAAWIRRYPDDARPAPEWRGEFAPRAPFVPQKTAALRRARWIVVAMGAAAVVGAALLLLR